MTPSLLPTTALASLLCLACATPALAQSADLNTWTKAGDVLINSATSATLTTDHPDESPLRLQFDGALLYFDLEKALSLQDGSLAADTIEGAGLQHSFDAAVGSTVRFDWQLTTAAFDAGQADRAFVLVDGQQLFTLGTVAAGVVSGQFSHSFASAGSHALAIVVMDVNTADGVSTLGISGFAVSAVPEPGQWALLMTGLAGLGTLLRRRRQSGG
jgi:hypothetical protein